MRAAIRVTPGAPRDAVGGRYPLPGRPDALLVRVTQPASHGRANAAARRAVAEALGVPISHVVVVSGHRSRVKIVEVPDSAAVQWRGLLDG